MLDWFLFGLLVYLGVVVGYVLLVLFVCFLIIGGLWVFLKIPQLRCKHERYYETRSCMAICTACGAKLGFIGNVRKKNPTGER